MSTAPSPQDAQALAARLVAETQNRLEGHPNCGPIKDKPAQAFPIGTLYPKSLSAGAIKEESNIFDEEEGVGRVLPSRHGLTFFARQASGILRLTVEFDLWHRSEGQKEAWQALPPPAGWNDDCSNRTIKASADIDAAKPQAGLNDLNAQLAAQLTAAGPRASWTDKDGAEHVPIWSAFVDIEATDTELDGQPAKKVKVILVNASDTETHPSTTVSEHFLRPRLTADLSRLPSLQPLEPQEFRAASKRRKPFRVLGLGIGCVARDDEKHTITTTNAPYQPLRAMDVPDDVPGVEVQKLAKDPLPQAIAFVQAVRAYGSMWEAQQKALENAGAQLAEFQQDYQDYRDEVAAMTRSLELLQTPAARQAFQLTFETLERMNMRRRAAAQAGRKVRPPVDRLYPFQLGYLLSALPDIVLRSEARAQRNASWKARADLIWFPTGGGKTEAFQLLATFTAFHDRLTGKARGVTAWLRFALRALTIQQTGRLLEVVYHAGAVKRHHKLPGEDFSLGFLVGEAYTPTEILDDRGDQGIRYANRLDILQRTIAGDPGKYVYTPECPECHATNVANEWDDAAWSLRAVCKTPDCPAGTLPVHVVDDELRRHPTTFTVGTIDKITGVGLSRRIQPMLRSPAFLCPEHGASVVANRKPQDVAKCSLKTRSQCSQKMSPCPPEDWGPSLVIIDEVHLLEEELGAYTAQYEACLREIQQSGGFPAAKVVLASATVSDYQEHVRQLTGLDARRFPGAPPRDNDGFWYREADRVQRHVLGIHPHGKTQEDTTLYILRAIQWSLRDMSDAKSPIHVDRVVGRTLSDAERKRLLRYYWTTLVYVLARFQGDQITRSLGEQMPNMLDRVDLSRADLFRNPQMISSDLTPEEQTAIIRALDDADAEDPEEAIMATSSISNGIDISLLNVLLMVGHPRRTSEDVQVTSRAGRRYPGIVFRLFHPIRERDLTHYQLFDAYHRNRDLLVEPVPVNRYSIRSVDRTMPGILMALLYATQGDRSGTCKVWYADRTAEALADPAVRSGIRDAIGRIYGEGVRQTFDKRVRDVLDNHLSLIEDPAEVAKTTQDRFPRGPMSSLRDVDETIPLIHASNRVREGLLGEFGISNRMERSRLQVIFKHLPESVFAYQGGQAIVKSSLILPDETTHRLGAIDVGSVVPRIQHLLRQVDPLQKLLFMPGGLKNVESRIQLVRPGKVLVELFPLVLQCNAMDCGAAWLFDPYGQRGSTTCPRCSRSKREARTSQLAHVAVHHCGNLENLWVKPCQKHRSAAVILKRAGRGPTQWKWVCDECGGEQGTFQYCQMASCKGGRQ